VPCSTRRQLEAAASLRSPAPGVNARIHSAAGPFFGRILQKVTEISPGLRVDTGAAVATLAADLAVQYHLCHIIIRTGIQNWLRFTYDFEIGSAE
jgi:O-acetyl-ADP-ribose deacetylase (regulator of RNase III)